MRVVLLLTPLIVLAVLTNVSASHVISLNSWQANNITIRSIAYGGVYYEPGMTYSYENFQIFAVQDCRALVTIVNLSTGKLLIIGTTQEGGSCWAWYNWVGINVGYWNHIIFTDPWLTINDCLTVAATYTG
ncbi:MAG: hypothetical protein ACLPY5_14275 [Candidatus Bathyarchaeia archaeon]